MHTFKPTWWLRHPHLQTLYPALFRNTAAIELITERLDTPDGDFIDLAYPADNGGALVLIFHGLKVRLNHIMHAAC